MATLWNKEITKYDYGKTARNFTSDILSPSVLDGSVFSILVVVSWSGSFVLEFNLFRLIFQNGAYQIYSFI